jgi:hypothetical protein
MRLDDKNIQNSVKNLLVGKGDVDQNCEMNMLDVSKLAANWLKCTDPDILNCTLAN